MRRNPRTKYCGVYAVQLIGSTAMYIGGSTDITGRYTHHRFMLRRGLHKCEALQNLWNVYGEEAFVFRTLERCAKTELEGSEDRWIRSTPECLNTIKSARYAAYPLTPERSARMSAAAKRRWARPDYREKREPFLARRDEGRFVGGKP